MVRTLACSGGTLRRVAGLVVTGVLIGLLAFAAPALAQTVTSVSPDAGVPGGGTTPITITGSGFTGATDVDFGTGHPASFTVNSDTSITTTSPSGTGTVDVTVTANGQTSPTSPADQYTYENAPTVTGLSTNNAGPLGGGTSVTITGTNFTDATGVSFGMTPQTGFTVVSPTEITTTSPQVAQAGTVDVTVTTPVATSAANPPNDQFSYDSQPAVTGIQPSDGPDGTSVTISGTGFSGVDAVDFGSTPASFTFNAGKLTAIAPTQSPGPENVTVTTPGGTSATSSADVFTYYPVPDVTNVQPNVGPLAGGTQVKITGTGFTGASAVDFGSTAATTFTVNSDGQITATSPSGSETVSITVTTPGGTSGTGGSAEEFTYTSAPGVTGISPNAGPTKGGTSVTIFGTGFTGAAKVMFGSTAATSFEVNSDSQITATSPGGSGKVDVTVTTNGVTSATGSADLFTYDPVPTVSSVSPRAGPLSGGPTITINGTGFTGATAVDFGPGNPATILTVSSTQITATLPAAASAGTVDVTVTTPGGTSATSAADQFTYDHLPVVSSLSQNDEGPVAGGTQVTINGTGFTGATAVDFAGVQASFTFDSDTKITATSPTGSAGAADVTVTTPGGTSATSGADQFTYFAKPAVTGVSPGAGPLAGGTQVTITGTGLTGATAVSFGSSAGTQVAVVSSTELTAVAPARPAGAVGVTVTTPGGTSSLTPPNSDQDFTYTNGPTITNLTPAAGPLGVATTVTITGTNLADAKVAFGSTTNITPSSNTGTSITVNAPPSSHAGKVNVIVSTPGGDTPTTGTADQFFYDPVPTVTSVTPVDGPDNGGTTVTVKGSGFSTGPTTVDFGAKSAQSVRVISDTQLTATAPAEPLGTIDIRVTTPGGTSKTSAADRFAFTPPLTPAIVKLSPSIGPIGGGTNVTITGSQFTGATAVVFGSKAASSFTVNSDTQVTAVSPPGSAGTVPVTVTTSAGGASESVAAGQFIYAAAPDVKHLAIGALAQRSATLHGTVDPNGLPVTACEFEYGTTRHYAHTVACSPAIPAASSPASVKATLKHLKPGTTYHYRLVARTASGTTEGADWTFSTNPLKVVGTPLVGLLLQRVTSPAGFIGKLLGVQGISRAAIGEWIVVRCVVACPRKLSLRIHLVNARIMRDKVSLSTAVMLSIATRIEIDVSAPGKLSRYARYSFTPAGRSVAVHITHSGCLSPAGLIVGCPRRAG